MLKCFDPLFFRFAENLPTEHALQCAFVHTFSIYIKKGDFQCLNVHLSM